MILGEGQQVVLDTDNWRGKRFPLLPHLSTSPQLEQGHWKVLLYHHDCGSCAEILDRWPDSMGLESSQDSRLAIIVLPSDNSTDPEFSALAPQPLIDSLPSDRDWLVTTPTVITLDQGVVIDTSRKIARTAAEKSKSLGEANASSNQQSKGPKPVQLKRNAQGNYDLGFIEPDSKHRLLIEFNIPSTQTVRITRIQPECDCMQVLDAPKALPPGKSSLYVTFQAINKRLEYSKRIILHTNDAKHSRIELPIHARIGLALRLQSGVLRLHSLPSGKIHPNQIIIHNDGVKPYKILYVTSDDPNVVARAKPDSLLPGKTQAIPLEINLSNKVSGKQSATLRLVTNSPGQRSLSLHVEYWAKEEN